MAVKNLPQLYDAIICYVEHHFDHRAAQVLYEQIVRYKIPRKLHRMHRNAKKYLYLESVNEGKTPLGELTRQHLDRSAFLIVVCSPRAKNSLWLEEIINYFKSTGKGEHILPLLIEGEPSEAFPPALFSERTIAIPNRDGEIEQVLEITEPLATDIRAGSIRKSLARIRPMRLKIIAAMIGCGYDDLEQRHLKQVRQRVLMMTAPVAFFSLILIIAFIYSSLNAIRQEMIAKRQTQMAVELLNSMFRELPQKFRDVPDAQPVIKGLILDNIRALNNSGSQSIKKFDIEELLKVKPGDSGLMILRKSRLLRELYKQQKSLLLIDNASKSTDTGLPPEYFVIARDFTQAGFREGEYIKSIDSNMPASHIGMSVGDIIMTINGNRVGEYNDLNGMLDQMPGDSVINITYLRWERAGLYTKRRAKARLRDGMLGITYEPI